MAYSSAQVAAMQYKKEFGNNKQGLPKRFNLRDIDETTNEFRFRIRNPNQFQKNSFRRLDIGKKGGFEAIVARPKGLRTTRIQALRLPKSQLRA